MAWVSIANYTLDQPKRKLAPKRQMFRVLKRIGPVSYKMDFPASFKWHSVRHVSELENVVIEPKYKDRPEPQPRLVKRNGDVERKYNRIISSKVENGKTYYEIEWEPMGETSWVWAGDVMDSLDKTTFHKNHPKMPMTRRADVPNRNWVVERSKRREAVRKHGADPEYQP